MPYNFVADSIHTKNFAADFFQAKWNFWRKTAILRFSPHLRLGATYAIHAHWQARSGEE